VVAFALLVAGIGEDFEPSDELSLAVRALAFSIITFSGLEGFRAVTGRDMTASCFCGFPGESGFPGEANRGDCGKVLELDDFGDKILISASRINLGNSSGLSSRRIRIVALLGVVERNVRVTCSWGILLVRKVTWVATDMSVVCTATVGTSQNKIKHTWKV
jgi:hypothetical protein